MALSLIAFDTDHIKSYVFGTDKLKEIRGASSILDRLNRHKMKGEKEDHSKYFDFRIECIYANGGGGLFLVEKDKAEIFAHFVQKAYHDETKEGASITYVVQRLPANIENLSSIEEIKAKDLHDVLELVRYRLRCKKDTPPVNMAIPSHPFMRPCNSCGIAYAEKERDDDPTEIGLYCASCSKKRIEDSDVKKGIDTFSPSTYPPKYLWNRILNRLHDINYDLPPGVQRPDDFNVFREFTETRDYLGLIYADANNMGVRLSDFRTLQAVEDFATTVDESVYKAMTLAIKEHLPVKQVKGQNVFPFDILLVGGDDIMMVTDAAKAMDVALTIAREFRRLTDQRYTLSVGVVLAPIKYPFELLYDMLESTLKFAKTAGADARAEAERTLTNKQDRDKIDDTRINFMTVTGSSHNNFKEIYTTEYSAKYHNTEFHTTLRPYDPLQLATLLAAIRTGHALNLGRTKLHQVREVVLKKNLTTSVTDGMKVLLSWREQQRSHVTLYLYSVATQYQLRRVNPQDPGSQFPHVTFPWFADGKTKDKKNIYRTSLLDFVELYDFVSREGLDTSDES